MRTVFYGIGAYEPTLDSGTKYSFKYRVKDNEYIDVKSIDVALSPEWARADPANRWPQVLVDDHYDLSIGGATRLPPAAGEDPGLYLEKGYCDANKIVLPEHGGEDYRDRLYEYTTVQYWSRGVDGVPDELADMRYYGFHAIVVSGTFPKHNVLVCHAGDSVKPREAKGTVLDFSKVDEVHPYEAGFTQIKSGVTSGAVFLSCAKAFDMGLEIPKLPAKLGTIPMPFCSKAVQLLRAKNRK